MSRFAFDSRFTPSSPGRDRMRPLREGPKDAARHRKQTILVPAGKTKLCILDDKALSAATDAKAVRLVSNVEGVDWWPIDSATPSVDENTRAFGWLLDLAAPDKDHAHAGIFSHIAVDVDNASEDHVFYDSLPSFLSYSTDRATPGDDHSVFTTKLAGQLINWRGNVLDMSVLATAGTNRRNTMYLIGMDGYWNLGTANDGLELHMVVYIADITKLNDLNVYLYCWPFTDLLLNAADVPALTDYGQAPWDPTDSMLDRMAKRAASLPANPTYGWLPANLTDGASISRQIDPSLLVNGWNVQRMTKASTVSHAASTSAGSGFAGDPVWNRITQCLLNVQALNGTSATTVYIGNIYFGPRPGLVRRLRPYEHCTDQPWSGSSIPAVGLQNRTSEDAEVEVEYWGL